MKNTFGHIAIPLQRIHLELTNICNMNCAFCPKSVMSRPPGFMDVSLAKRIISEIAENRLCDKITFHVMGEPTLHPNFFEILEHAAAKGQKVGLTTNGATLGGDIGKKLLQYELHQMDISLQTPDEASFALRRSGSLTFERYFNGIMNFFAQYHVKYPESIFKFRLMNTIYNHRRSDQQSNSLSVITSTQHLRQIVAHYGLEIYKLSGVPIRDNNAFYKRIESIAGYKWNVIEVIPNTFLETYVLSGWGNAFGDNINPSNYGYCYGMRDHFGVLYNGDLVLCCIDYDGMTRQENICNSSLEKALSSPALKEIMDGFKKYRLIHPYCKRCQGSRSLLSGMVKPVASILALRLLKPFFYKHTRLFE